MLKLDLYANFSDFMDKNIIGKKLLIISFILLGLSASKPSYSLSFGPVNIGESRIPIELKDFKLRLKKFKKHRIKVKFIKESVQWVRTEANLLTPRARVAFSLPSNKFYLNYNGQSIILEKRKNKYYSEIYIPLFNPGKITVYKENEKYSEVVVRSNFKDQKNKPNKMIDYSCSRYNLNISGLEDDYISIGCHLEKVGKFGHEKPRLELTWSTTNYRLPNMSEPPYKIILSTSSKFSTQLIDDEGNKRLITIEATLPKRLKRVKTALGFGPYLFRSVEREKGLHWDIAPAFMIYGKVDIRKKTSFRFFDAVVYNKSVFNNFGLYFAYEVANALDKRFELIPLLGLQTLTFKFENGDPSRTEIIYPQGFEAVWKHAFNKKNYTFVYGMFVDPSSKVDYKNLWVRYGKGYFWELNYIDWRKNGKLASMWGLSVGIPFMSFF